MKDLSFNFKSVQKYVVQKKMFAIY